MWRWILTSTLLLTAGGLYWDLRRPVHSDLRKFDPQALGQLDSDMWRSYYERRPARLLQQMTGLLRQQFGLSFTQSWLAAYYATRGAFVFKDGHDGMYADAIPPLRDYYRVLMPTRDEKYIASAAELELRWWILHRQQSPQLAQSLMDLEAHLYQAPAERFARHAELRAEAMRIRDAKAQTITEADWTHISNLLRESWLELWRAVN